MELTDKETLYKKIKSICDGCKFYNENSCACCFMTECCNAVEDAPMIDAVLVVRCKDCKHRDPEDKICDCGCWHIPFITNDDDFCSYGERKEVQ